MTESAEPASENRSIYRLRWVGYGLLVFALLDVISILIPPEIGSSTWRLQAIGALVERAVVPLLGFALVFFGEFFDRRPIEGFLLRSLSWLCLLSAIVSFTLAPTALLNTLGLDNQQGQQLDAGVQQRLGQLKQLEDQINQGRPEDITKFATQLNSVGITKLDTQDPQKAKADLLARIKIVREQTAAQAQATRSAQRLGLFKNTIKWALGAVIAGVLFFILWKTSNWAR